MMADEDWKAAGCEHCDFSSGTRGMDRCAKCGGTGSQLVLRATGQRFPNTEAGFARMETAHAALASAPTAGGERG